MNSYTPKLLIYFLSNKSRKTSAGEYFKRFFLTLYVGEKIEGVAPKNVFEKRGHLLDLETAHLLHPQKMLFSAILNSFQVPTKDNLAFFSNRLLFSHKNSEFSDRRDQKLSEQRKTGRKISDFGCKKF